MTDGGNNYPYDVALSFASEQRLYVEAVNRYLLDAGVTVFYDENQTAELWGAQGTERFAAVYSNEAFRVVMFISEEYVNKGWPTIERRAALGRLVDDPNSDHILPVRFDDTLVPGLDPQRIFVRATDLNAADLGALIIEHLVKTGRCSPDLLTQESHRTAQARLVSMTSVIDQAADGTWSLKYRIENRSDSALDGVVLAISDPGADECRPADQMGCAMEMVFGVIGPGQLLEDVITDVRLTAEPSFGELPYLGSLLWTDIDEHHWMVNGATLTRRPYRARTC